MIREIRTSKLNNSYFKNMPRLEAGEYDKSRKVCVINSNKTSQAVLGFGGAFTQSSAYCYDKMSAKNKETVISSLFSNDGLGYNLGRVHINSCDFSSGNYSYINDGENTLDNFDISCEKRLVIPFINAAQAKADKKLDILASPWSPPAHFKTSNQMNLGGELKPQYMQLWADYYVRYICEMQKCGVDIKYVSVQNEPAAVQTWDSCEYSAEQERDFIKNYLGATLEKSGLKTKLLIWDHNRDIMVERANTVLCDPQCNKYVWGTAFHWYAKGNHENLSILKELYPDKHLLFTEGCVELNNSSLHEDGNTYAGDWRNGEMYAKNIINDFNNYNEGFIDWNLILDERGGGNHANNFCEAPIMYNTKTDNLIFNPSYYFIGHFSKFIKTGAKHVYNINNCGQEVFCTAFKNPDNQKVIVILNTGYIKKIALIIDSQGVNITLAPNSISTFLAD